MRPFSHAARWAGVAVLLAAAGCGSGNVSVYPVKGKITFDGKPMVGGGAIAFIPLGDQKGKAPGGEIASDGSYTLTTYRPGDGSMAGEFRVLITQAGEKEPEATPDGQRPAKVAAGVAPADRIPAVYGDPEHSPLRATVEAKSLNEINFDLKRGAAAPSTRPKGAAGPLNRGDRVAHLQR